MPELEYDEVEFFAGPWDGERRRVWPDEIDVVVPAVPPSPYHAPAVGGRGRLLTAVPRYPMPSQDYGRYQRLTGSGRFDWAGWVR